MMKQAKTHEKFSFNLVDAKTACKIIGAENTPIHQSTFWKGIKAGKYPQPIHLGVQLRRWRSDEILESIKKKELVVEKGEVERLNFPVSIKDKLIDITNLKPMSGVYFLFKDKNLIYIGQSTNVLSRVRNHKNNPHSSKIEFDEVLLYPCEGNDLTNHETILIRTFNPPANRKY